MSIAELNRIGKSFTVNDDSVATRIDSLIANSSKSLNVIDNYPIGGINSKIVSDTTSPVTLHPPVNIIGDNSADHANGIQKNSLKTLNFANQKINNTFADKGGSNDYVIPTLNKKPKKKDELNYSNNILGGYYTNNTFPPRENRFNFNKSNIAEKSLNKKPNNRNGIIRDSLINRVIDVEGGYSDRKNDKGGKTNYGISWETWTNFAKPTLGVEPTEENQKNMSRQDASKIYKENYWDKYRIDEINNIDLKHLVFDVFVNNTGNAAKIVQGVLKNDFKQDLEIDGIMGSKTINTLNNVNPDKLHDKLLDARKVHYDNIVKKSPSQIVNYNGWIKKRVNDFRKQH